MNRVEDILRECRRIYRLTRSGAIATQDMSRFVNVLHIMVSIMRDSNLEARLTKLEKTYDARQQDF